MMSLEQAVRRLTFESASTFGIFDRGLLRPAWRPTSRFSIRTRSAPPEDVVHDFPAGGWRVRELAEGIHYTIVNGQVLLEDGQHTGALPGRVLRNTLSARQRKRYLALPSPVWGGRGVKCNLANDTLLALSVHGRHLS